MDTSGLAGGSTLDGGLLIVRLVFGLLMAAHGTQKLFGWFGGYGLDATGEFFIKLGFGPARALATAASLGEVASGLLVAVGFLGPVGPAIMLSIMLVASVTVHWKNGLFASANGIEIPLLYGTAAVGLALAGPGRWSLDALLGLLPLWTPGLIGGAIGIGVLGALVNLAFRRRSPSHQA